MNLPILCACRLPEDVACFLVAQIILGLEHMHSRGICYRDLKGHSFEADLWSLGCVTFEMLRAVPPFFCNNNVPVIAHRMHAYCESIRNGMKPFFPQQGDISDVAWDLIFHLLRVRAWVFVTGFSLT
ncbi:kinase-like domain-containing protein [Dunaliella salina]|uniref:Kinase-like domain-containing protein n=1 Tax=Dunaliella salina TaxID=3046 RepID=A0ABQ7G0N8_DUNSA|nr:kinase-like domain-containing protein [Dunaliella salina]|eukprot:KAF5828164.1 kinase-like domain-containing protein [Dunaliella salina]